MKTPKPVKPASAKPASAKAASTAADPCEAIATLRTQTAPKLGGRSTGLITYRVGRSASGAHLGIVANDGGGYFSAEMVPFSKVRLAAAALAPDADFPTSALRPAFVGKSVNNACFLAAILRNEGLLQAGEKPHLHRLAGDWDGWEAAQLSTVPAAPQEHRETDSGAGDAAPVESGPEPVPEDADYSAGVVPESEDVPDDDVHDEDGPGMTTDAGPAARKPRKVLTVREDRHEQA
jgi:hypothetical protein